MVATLAEGVVPWLGAIAECHLRICGRHGVVLLLGAMVGYHCWVPCCFIAGVVPFAVAIGAIAVWCHGGLLLQIIHSHGIQFCKQCN